MNQRKIAPWIYGFLVSIAAFVLGYFAGTSVPGPEISVTTTQPPQVSASIVSQQPAQQQERMDLIDLNTATQPELETLPGIGPVLAERILRYRTEIGRFVSTEQLMDVEGVGQTRYDNLKHLIIVEVAP